MATMSRLAGTMLAVSLLLTPLCVPAQHATAQPADAAEDAAKGSTADNIAKQIATAKAVTPSLVVVEYTVKYDKGDPPTASPRRWSRQRYSRFQVSGEEAIQQERPVEAPGFLIAGDTVVTADPLMHERFIESIAVRFDGALVKAKVKAVGVEQGALFLQLDKPLKGAKPLKFDAQAKGPYMLANLSMENAVWSTVVGPMNTQVWVDANGGAYRTMPDGALIVTGKGKPVALSMVGRAPAAKEWKGSPTAWKTLSIEDHTRRRDALKDLAADGLLRVVLNFRSPKRNPADPYGYQRDFGDDGQFNASATELNAAGVLVSGDQVLILAKLEPKITARLSRIRVFDRKGEAHTAKFLGTLKEYGALIAKLDKPMTGPVTLAEGDMKKHQDKLVLSAQLRIAGEERIAYFWHDRILGFETGWQRNAYPHLASGWGESSPFLFDTQGQLLALPINRREKVAVRERYSYRDNRLLTPVSQLLPVLKDPTKHFDSNNVPLSEAEENRIAWLGLVLQPLTRELARANKVAKLTMDGRVGALVTYVYPDSPAAKAGIEPGVILLRLHAEGQPKPIDMTQMDDMSRYMEAFPWDQLDEVPEQYFERIPRPWPPAQNRLTKVLTALGFGTKFEAEFIVDGKPVRKPFVATQSPPHYDTTKRYKSKRLGITVRDLTYEVRRQLQVRDTDPGVIISKIEPGSKASVAGIKPYEMVTQINGTTVHNVAEFEKAIKDATELRVSVKRMSRSRQVQIKLDSALPDADKKDDK